ncbi:MAG: class I SAM-dependent methyltransferase [Saprospiraceae bacterium]
MDKQYYKDYYHLERQHWWFTARIKILEDQIKRLVSKKNITELSILNIGIATGATTQMLEKFGKVTSLEYDKDCCEFVREKCKIDVVFGSMTELPFASESYDIVCAFDVVEHIEDDNTAIAELKRVMKNDGDYILTVPAFMFMWSDHDVINHHFRRYTRANFKHLLQSNSLKIKYATYFNSLLFMPIAFVRVLQKLIVKPKVVKKSDFDGMNSTGIVNSLLRQVFLIEKPILTSRIPLPFGISILITGTK